MEWGCVVRMEGRAGGYLRVVVAGGAFCGGCGLCGKFRVPIGALARFIPEESPWYAWWCPRF